MPTRDLPPSGTIKQSEVIAEFGKGNNLLDYLGEGGVTGSAPLKLTDFYGKSSGPQLPTTPQHTWSGVTIKQRVPTSGYNQFSQTNTGLQMAHRGLFIQSGGFNYGLNQAGNGVSVASDGAGFSQKIGGGQFGDINGVPVRSNIGIAYASSNASGNTFTSTVSGKGDSTYSLNDAVAVGMYIPPQNLPFNDQSPYIGIVPGSHIPPRMDYVIPGSIAIVVYAAVKPDASGLANVLGQVSSASSYNRYHAVVGYKYVAVPEDLGGSTSWTPPVDVGSGYQINGCIYSADRSVFNGTFPSLKIPDGEYPPKKTQTPSGEEE